MVAKRTQLCCTQQSLVKFSEMFSSFGRGLRTQGTLHLPSGTFPVKLFWRLNCCFKWLLSHATPKQVWCGRNIGLRSNKTT